jgi:threonine dehydratase
MYECAAALAGKVPLDSATVITLTGGNTDAEAFARTIAPQRSV